MPDGTDEGWGPLREDLAADVVRVSDRLAHDVRAKLERRAAALGTLPPSPVGAVPKPARAVGT